MNKKILYAVVAVIVVAGLGYWGWTTYGPKADTSTKTTQTAPTPTPTPSMATEHSVSYQGEDGKTALAVLQEKYPDAVISGEGANAFVTTINGYAASADKHEFWKFMVNSEDAQVGAGSYTTKSTDTIMWMIDTY